MSRNAITYCVSGSHIQLTAVSIASISENYISSETLDVIVISDDITSQDVQRIRNIPTFYGKEQIKVFVWAPPEIVKEIKGYSNIRFPEVTLWRLFIPSYFPKYEKIIYFDNDTVIYDDVTLFFDLLTSDYLIAAVRDFYAHMYSYTEDLAEQYGIDTMRNYFNSGFIIFNTAYFNLSVSPERLLKMVNEQKYDCLDQTILNIVCSGKIKYLPFSYNYQKDDHWLYGWAIHYNAEVAKEIEKQRLIIKVRHFCEFEKNSMPWEHLLVLDKWEADFWEYLYTIKYLDLDNNN